MDSYERLYHDLLEAAFQNRLAERVKEIRESHAYDEAELELLLHPGNLPPVIKLPADCGCDKGQPSQCQLGCLFSAITRDENGKIVISTDDCVGCAECIDNCTDGRLKERRDLLPLFEMLNLRETPIYAMIAPAFIGQFSKDVTVGKLRKAFKMLGFQGLVEVALFADILTLKEALEYDRLVRTDEDFLLTSCCCPVWVAMIRRAYSSLAAHIPPSVSPMVACGRAIKRIHPEARTVFIGPCLAKKAEAKENDIADAVDAVLTFQEVKDILEISGIDIAALDDDQKEHSSSVGRCYASTGGVSRAVEQTVQKLHRGRQVPMVTQQAEGVKACKAMLESLAGGRASANFLEGMGCVGGCVGGPRVMIDSNIGKQNVLEYGAEAAYETPVDNPYTFELLRRLGFDTIEALLEHDNMFTRDLT